MYISYLLKSHSYVNLILYNFFSAELRLTRRRNIHKELLKFSELVHWMKNMDPKVSSFSEFKIVNYVQYSNLSFAVFPCYYTVPHLITFPKYNA